MKNKKYFLQAPYALVTHSNELKSIPISKFSTKPPHSVVMSCVYTYDLISI